VLAGCGGQSSSNESTNAQAGAVANASGENAVAAIPAAGPDEKRMTIKALPVSTPGPGLVMGSVQMIRSASGIETDGIGGACLAFEDPASKTCRADSDCRVPGYISAAGGPFASCADQKCWIKPADKAFCWKSRYSTPPEALAIGQAKSTPQVKLSDLPAQLFQGPAKNQVRARVVACLNGKYGPDDVPPCAGGDKPKVEVAGDARTLTK
jgi:hypothetical protein